jgi:epoxyqueuosine reductase
LIPILELNDEEFNRKYKNSPVKRTKRIGLQRNACVALGNNRDPNAVKPLYKALQNSDSLVKSHAAWALGQIATKEAGIFLREAYITEMDNQVKNEIRLALDQIEKRN